MNSLLINLVIITLVFGEDPYDTYVKNTEVYLKELSTGEIKQFEEYRYKLGTAYQIEPNIFELDHDFTENGATLFAEDPRTLDSWKELQEFRRLQADAYYYRPYHKYCCCDPFNQWEECPLSEQCNGVSWTCSPNEVLHKCGRSCDGRWACYCDTDVNGTPVCWQNDWCINLSPCNQNSDCNYDEVCTNSCCDGGDTRRRRCIKKCEHREPINWGSECGCKHSQTADWKCGINPTPYQCGKSDSFWSCYCLPDNNPFDNVRNSCVENNWCSALTNCPNGDIDCPAGYECIPNNCCGKPKCAKCCSNPN